MDASNHGDRKRYEATIRQNIVLWAVLGSWSLLMICAGAMTSRFSLVAAGVCALGWLIAMRLRLYVLCTEEYLERRGFFETRRVAWRDITRVSQPTKTDPWASRVYGPAAFCFHTASDYLKINFMFYPPECRQEVLRRAPVQPSSG